MSKFAVRLNIYNLAAGEQHQSYLKLIFEAQYIFCMKA